MGHGVDCDVPALAHYHRQERLCAYHNMRLQFVVAHSQIEIDDYNQWVGEKITKPAIVSF